MKNKVDFGFNTDRRLNSQFAGIGSMGNATDSPVAGEIISFINFEDADYLVSKVTMSFGDSKNGMIDVRQVAKWTYQDGSYVLYSTNSPSKTAIALNRLLNSKIVSDKLTDEMSVIDILNDLGFDASESLISTELHYSQYASEIVTSVNDENFKEVLEHQKSGKKSR